MDNLNLNIDISSKCIFCYNYNFPFVSQSSSFSDFQNNKDKVNDFKNAINSWTTLLELSPDSFKQLKEILCDDGVNSNLTINKISCEKCQNLVENGKRTIGLIKKIQNELDTIKNEFKKSIHASVTFIGLSLTNDDEENELAAKKAREIILRDLGYLKTEEVTVKCEKLYVGDVEDDDSTCFNFPLALDDDNDNQNDLINIEILPPNIKLDIYIPENNFKDQRDLIELQKIKNNKRKRGRARKTPVKKEISSDDKIVRKPQVSHGWIFPKEDYRQCCDKYFEQKKLYFSHKFRYHGGEKYFKCELCEEVLGTNGLYEIHKRDIHSDLKKIQCNHCDKDFFSNKNLKLHMANFHSGPRPKTKCKFCEFESVNLAFLKVHEKGHSNPLLCTICGLTTYTKNQLKCHISTKHPEKVEPKKFKCQICSYKVDSKDSFEKHMAYHSDTRKLICDICGLTFKKKIFLKNHLENIHKPHSEKKFKCPVCPKGFISGYALNVHQLSHLPKEQRNLKCKNCDKKFYLKQHLIAHESTHSDKRDFICSICSKGFPNNLYLKSHHYHVHVKKKKNKLNS